MVVTADHSKVRRRPGVRPLFDVHYSDARRKVKRPQNWTTDDKGKPVPIGKRYEVRWVDHDGRQRSERFADKRDAQARHTALVTEFETGSHIPRERARTLVSAVAQTYIDTALAAKPVSTRSSYESTLGRFTARFGDREVGSLVPSDLQGWVGGLASGDKPLSLASRRKYLAVVRKMLDSAVRDGLIARNPAAGVDLGRERAHREDRGAVGRKDIPTPENLGAIWDAVGQRNPTVARLLVFMALTGLRVGEAAELRRRDIDSTAWTLGVDSTGADRLYMTVSRSVSEHNDSDGQRIVGLPKSGRPRRVPLSRPALELLREQTEAAQIPSKPDALVFPNRAGGQFRGSNINDPILKDACAALGVDRVTCHHMRHYFVSDALRRGATLPDVSAWVGHADTAVTGRVYAHVVGGRSGDSSAALLD